MKPLNKSQLKNFTDRFDNFKESQIRSFKIISPIQVQLELAVQDSAREFNWITLELLFSDITDAKLIEDEKLHLLDLNDGISIINSENQFAFALGECYNISTIKNSIFYIISNNIKYKESSF